VVGKVERTFEGTYDFWTISWREKEEHWETHYVVRIGNLGGKNLELNWGSIW